MASPFTPPTIPGAQGYPLGLTGATAATRYVGATASGAPASGAFQVGDFIIDQTGTIYVCTVAGSPGTWAAPSGGISATILDAKGDIIAASAADTAARLAVGTNTHVLTADSSQTTGLKYALPNVPRLRKTGSYYNAFPSTADGTLTAVLNQVYYSPFPVYVAQTLDRISLGVSGAGGAGSVVRLGIYSSDTNGQPSALVLDAGTIDGTSATYQEKTISQALTANTLYWCAVCWQVGTAGTVRAIGAGNGSEFLALGANSSDPRASNYQEAGVTGAFAAATPAAGGTTNPAVKVRIA